jgi:hypothetical protein
VSAVYFILKFIKKPIFNLSENKISHIFVKFDEISKGRENGKGTFSFQSCSGGTKNTSKHELVELHSQFLSCSELDFFLDIVHIDFLKYFSAEIYVSFALTGLKMFSLLVREAFYSHTYHMIIIVAS